MIVLIFLFIFALICTRCCSTYDSKRPFGKYVIIKNNALSKVLIDNYDWVSYTTTSNIDRNKMSLVGMFFYVLFGIITIGSIVLLFIKPIKCNPIDIEAYQLTFYIKTFNILIPCASYHILLSAEWFYYALKFMITEKCKDKWKNIVIYICCIFLILICLISIFAGFYLLVTS